MTSGVFDPVPTFALHPRLAADTLPIGSWPLCTLLLMNDRHYPWLILVPRRAGISEIHDLDQDDRARLIEEVAAASRALSHLPGIDKINVAALGNIVPQLHVHILARRTSDPAWPQPVWGRVPPHPYEEAEVTALIARLRADLPDLA